MKNCLSCLVALFTISACTFNRTYLNEETEKVKAERAADSLYTYIQVHDFDRAEELFSDTFFSITDREGLQTIFTKAVEKLGTYRGKKLIEWKTRRVVGSDPLSQYLLIYEIYYQKYKAKETITLKEEEDGVKIVSYNIESKGFLD